MGKIDLLIVEDDKSNRDDALFLAEEYYGLKCLSFESGVEALKYLKQQDKNNLPKAFLVDMRIEGSSEELDSPLEIFNYLKEQNQLEHFRFHTGHFSEHDQRVHEITNAQVILKGEPEIHVFLEILKNTK